jgi:SpoIID/LytB domain protein
MGLWAGLFFFTMWFFPPALRADSLQAQLGRWFALGETGQVQEAIRQSLEKDPSQVSLYLEWADLDKSLGDWPGAVAAYQGYLSRKEDWMVRARWALALAQMGRWMDAEGPIEDLLKTHPDDPDLLWGLARLRMLQAVLKQVPPGKTRQERLESARDLFSHLAHLNVDNALVHFELAEVCRHLGDQDRAMVEYQAALRRDASTKKGYRYLAELFAQKKRHTEALQMFEQALAIEPDDPDLKRESELEGRMAPSVVSHRKVQRLLQWEEWKAPPETPIAASPVTIRVGLFTGMKHLLFRCSCELGVTTPSGRAVTVLPAGSYEVFYLPAPKAGGGREKWLLSDSQGRQWIKFSHRLYITPRDPHLPFEVHAVPSNTGYFYAREEDRAYRGLMEIEPRPGEGFQVVNRVSLEDYTAGVLPAEMSYQWPVEALRTQAIVVRTYVLSKLGRHNSEGFDVCDSVHCEVYRGLRAEKESTNQAVNATAGQILTRGGHVVSVAFSAQCGGHTQDYEEAWGFKSAVVGVPDYDADENPGLDFPLSPSRLHDWIKQEPPAYCRIPTLRGYGNFRWQRIIAAKDLEKRLPEAGRIRRLVVERRSSAGWAELLRVEGTGGVKTVHGDIIRRFLGGLRSSLIWIEPQCDAKGWPVEYVIEGGGWGHGVGLCQVGCYGMALAGKKSTEILRHYFPLAQLTAYEPKRYVETPTPEAVGTPGMDEGY